MNFCVSYIARTLWYFSNIKQYLSITVSEKKSYFNFYDKKQVL